MKEGICTGIGVVGSLIASAFGGWDAALITLILFMAIDYISGLLVAGVFHNSKKTETGTLESRAGWKGLCRKGMTLLFVLIAYRLVGIVSRETWDAAKARLEANRRGGKGGNCKKTV